MNSFRSNYPAKKYWEQYELKIWAHLDQIFPLKNIGSTDSGNADYCAMRSYEIICGWTPDTCKQCSVLDLCSANVLSNSQLSYTAHIVCFYNTRADSYNLQGDLYFVLQYHIFPYNIKIISLFHHYKRIPSLNSFNL